MKNLKESLTAVLTGEVIISKRELALIAAVCGLAGIVIGLLSAPFTHGVMFGCNNGNGNHGVEDKEDATESIGVCECGEN